MATIDNENPQVYEVKDHLSIQEQQQRLQNELDDQQTDPIDCYEIYDIVRHIQDPEHPLTLEQLNIVNPKHIEVGKNYVRLQFTPTIPHCSLAQTIGLLIKVKLIRSLPKLFKIEILIFPGSHSQEVQVNKQINDKERVSAALENSNVIKLVKRGLVGSDKLPISLEYPNLINITKIISKMGAYLSKPKTEKHTIVGQFPQNENPPKIKYFISEMQGWRVNMEDSQICAQIPSHNVNVFGVFDGHGGPEVAKFVEKKFVDDLQKNQNFKHQKYKEALIDTFLRMDELLQTQQGQNELFQIKKQFDPNATNDSQAGCTANVILITPLKIFCANAGDSRSVVSYKGMAHELSFDHKPDNLEEKQRIYNAGGEITDGRVNGNLNLSRAIGDLEYKVNASLKVDEQLIIAKPDVHEWDIQTNGMIDFIVMGCDGIWECKSNQQIVDYFKKVIKNKENRKIQTERFLDSILAKDTQGQHGLDNMSIIFIEFVK